MHPSRPPPKGSCALQAPDDLLTAAGAQIGLPAAIKEQHQVTRTCQHQCLQLRLDWREVLVPKEPITNTGSLGRASLVMTEASKPQKPPTHSKPRRHKDGSIPVPGELATA